MAKRKRTKLTVKMTHSNTHDSGERLHRVMALLLRSHDAGSKTPRAGVTEHDTKGGSKTCAEY